MLPTCILFLLSLIFAFFTTPSTAISFQDVQDAFKSLQHDLDDQATNPPEDPRLLLHVSTTPGFTATIIQLASTPGQNLSISGSIVSDHVLNQSITQLTTTSSLAPTTNVPVTSFHNRTTTLNFQMIQKQLTCKEQEDKELQKQVQHTANVLQTIKDSGYKFIGFTFVGNLLGAGYAQTSSDGAISAVFVSVFDGRLLAEASQDKLKTTTVQVIFTSYDGTRPALNEVTVPANLLALC